MITWIDRLWIKDFVGSAKAGVSTEMEQLSGQVLWAMPTDWEKHRETIRRLYVQEKRSLKEVMHIMGAQYDFYAT